MDGGARLSPRERRILAEIEHDLRADDSLARTLVAGRPPARTGRHAVPVAVAVLGPATAILFVAAVATGSPALLWSFAAAWVLTAAGALDLLLRWSGRRRTRAGQDRQDEPGETGHGGVT
ncbi:DUF3040 domain-containing protein [Streptomyces sp. NPDC126499]|uniref:DUF3040 domain-containing protein n=1 Tax=Streptomyces sp. NPDC126499 TaxID=3155314 RepID=UPI00332AF87B